MDQLSYRRHRFPPPIIQHAIWLYLRFTLSYRDVEELLVATAAAKVALERLASPRDPTAVERRKPSTAEATLPGVPPVQGRADVNLRISQARAENVSRILREQARLLNAMQTIGMGGTELLDSSRPDQNRAVEIWVVVPL